jgi:predicted naringenin-chalcone synthase
VSGRSSPPGGVPNGRRARIAAVATAAPAFWAEQAEVGEELLRRAAGALKPRSVSLSRKLFAHPSIRKRHFAIDSADAFFSEDPDRRIARFTERSIGLSAEAVRAALARGGVPKDRLKALVVNTCTGYICPGLSTYLIEELDLPRDTRVYDLVGSGCGGAVPNLELARALAERLDDGVVAGVSVEICSATMQVGDELSLLVSNVLFGDGAAAVLVSAGAEGLEIVDTASWYVPESRDAIRYVHRGGQLHNQLSTDLPDLVKGPAAAVVRRLLEPRSLGVADVRHWALHTGGDKILREIGDEIGLTQEQLAPARKIPAEYGNMSSPTVWFVLDELLAAGVRPGEWCVMLAFGAGLSAHGCLLRRSAGVAAGLSPRRVDTRPAGA